MRSRVRYIRCVLTSRRLLLTMAGAAAACLLAAATVHANDTVGDYDGNVPASIALSPDGRTAYVPQCMAGPAGRDSQVAIIDTASNRQRGYVRNYSGWCPFFAAFAPDGKTAYVVNNDNTISVIDAGSDSQTGQVQGLPHVIGYNPPSGWCALLLWTVAFSRDSQTAYATYDSYDGTSTGGCNQQSYYDPGIAVIDVGKGKVSGFIPPAAQGLAGARVIVVAPKGDKAYVANPYARTVSVIDTRSNTTVKDDIQDWAKWAGPTPQAWDIVFSPDGETAYISSADALVVVDANADKAVGSVDLGAYGYTARVTPRIKARDAHRSLRGVYPGLLDIAFTPDSRLAFVVLNQPSDDNVGALKINTATHTLIGPAAGIDASDNWFARENTGTALMAVSPDSKVLYMAMTCGYTYSKEDAQCYKDYGGNYIASVNIAAPNVRKVAPASGSSLGGTQVEITGSNFTGGTAVYFGGVSYPGTNLHVVSDSKLTVTTPAHPVATVGITVMNPAGGGTLTPGYAYISDR